METVIIQSREDLHETINAINDMQDEAAAINDKIKTYLKAAEKYAKENPAEAFHVTRSSDETDRARYWLEKKDPALCLQRNVTEEDVVKLLGADPECEAYVKKTFDKAALKNAFGGNRTSRMKIKAYGLQFTDPQDHLKVASL